MFRKISTCLTGAFLFLALTCGAQPVTKIATGWYHSLFLKNDGSLSGMGWNYNGQLGDGSANSTNRPERVVTGGVKTMAGGLYHSLILKTNGSLWAVGNNGWGQLGDGTFNQTYNPELIVPTNVTVIAAGSQHSLFLTSGGRLWAMGYNLDGELGDGVFNTNTPYGTNTPQLIVASNVTAIAAGQWHSLFLKSDGSLWAMGANNYGQLGDGSTNSVNVPELIVTNGVVAIAAGEWHSLFLKSDGSLWAMGNNQYGQLGDGTNLAYSPYGTNRPEQILTSNVTAIAAGDYHSLLLKNDGSLWGMGQNTFGQLGVGSLGSTNRPMPILAGGVATMVAGQYYSLFLKSDGSLWGMGYNGIGQLGDGTLSNTNRPEQIVGAYNRIASQVMSDSSLRLSFVGIGGTNYALDRAFNLTAPNWIPLITNPADASGALIFTDTPSAATNNFWRIRSVP